MSFPAYPHYRESGVDWLGEVPEHWRIRRLRFVAALNPSRSEISALDRATAVTFLPMEAIGEDGSISREREKTIAEVESGYTYFRDGDVVVAKITPCFENGKGALVTGLTNGIGFGTTELIVARPRIGQVDSRFLNLLFQSPEFRALGEARMYGAGGQKRVPDSFVRDFTTAFPPVAEQCTIVDFLHRETARIGALMAEQRRLIQLLKEKRRAVIAHTITRGLDRDAPVKPSGVEWLGEVPRHWTVTRLKHLVDPGRQITYGIVQAGPHHPDGVPYIRPADMADEEGVVDPDGMLRTTPEIAAAYARSTIRTGDLVCSIGPSFGKVMITPAKLDGANLTQGTARIAIQPPHHARFFFWVLRSTRAQAQWESSVGGATFRALNLGPLASTFVPVPPPEEQREIAAFLGNAVNTIDSLVAGAHSTIALLQERRTALISAAVTGKIDVRGLAEAA